MEKQVGTLAKLACALNRRDEEPNIALAEQIAKTANAKAVKELVDNLHNKNRDIQNDCIKVLYETGERKPALIAPYTNNFLELLQSKNNRLQWGGMTALSAIVNEDAKKIYKALPRIVDAADSGSVITRDQAVSILLKLCTHKQFADDCFQLFLLQLASSPTNQLPMYAENALGIINAKNGAALVKALTARLPEIEKESKRKRVEKVIQKVKKML